MKVFGLNYLARKASELLMKEVQDKNDPEKWVWTPSKPEKIKNIKEIVEKEKKAVRYAVMTNYEPAKTKQSVVLLFYMGNLNYGLLSNLDDEKINFFFIDYPQLIIQGEVCVVADREVNKRMLKIGDAALDLNDVKVVLWNPPRFPSPLFDWDMIPLKKGRHKYLFKKRWMQFLRELRLLVPEDVVWVPGDPYKGSQEWQDKLGEYLLAKSLGFNIPPMIYTNDVNELQKFVSRNGAELLLREFSVPPFSFPPVKIDLKKASTKLLRKSPCCFQKYIVKKFELRVVVLFDKVFPCKIYSQNSDVAKDDWRVHDDAKVAWELITLPSDIKENLIKLRKSLELNWISVDMIYSDDEKYYFLEANRPGAHYWLDLFVGLDISREIVAEIKLFLQNT